MENNHASRPLELWIAMPPSSHKFLLMLWNVREFLFCVCLLSTRCLLTLFSMCCPNLTLSRNYRITEQEHRPGNTLDDGQTLNFLFWYIIGYRKKVRAEKSSNRRKSRTFFHSNFFPEIFLSLYGSNWTTKMADHSF